jgi:hypothetical protein
MGWGLASGGGGGGHGFLRAERKGELMEKNVSQKIRHRRVVVGLPPMSHLEGSYVSRAQHAIKSNGLVGGTEPRSLERKPIIFQRKKAEKSSLM